MTLSRDLLTGLANAIWTTVIGLIVVPLYIKYLGMEAYGLIGFFAMTQALLQLLDLGLAPTMNREVARCAASGDVRQAARLLHTLGVVYWAVAGIIAVALIVAGPAIAQHWLRSRQLSPEAVARGVMLMGFIVACRWPTGLYLGALMGAERLTVASGLGILMATVSNGGAVIVLAFVSPTIHAFFLWQAGVGLAYAVAVRWAAWRAIGRLPDMHFDMSELRRVWRFSAGMSGLAVYGVAFTQIDKVLLSRMLALEEFGRYMLATTVVAALYVLVTPLFNVVYPRFSSLVVLGETAKVTSLYRNSARLLGAGLFPAAALLVFFGEDVISVWTGNPELAANTAPIISMLAMASALHGVMYVPYALQLAHGLTRLPLTIATILLVVQVPIMVVLAMHYGALGGAVAWLVLQILYVALGTWMTHRHLLRGLGASWLLRDVGTPLLISMLIGYAGHEALRGRAWAPVLRVAWGGALMIAASGLTFVLSPRLRAVVVAGLGWTKSPRAV